MKNSKSDIKPMMLGSALMAGLMTIGVALVFSINYLPVKHIEPKPTRATIATKQAATAAKLPPLANDPKMREPMPEEWTMEPPKIEPMSRWTNTDYGSTRFRYISVDGRLAIQCDGKANFFVDPIAFVPPNETPTKEGP